MLMLKRLLCCSRSRPILRTLSGISKPLICLMIFSAMYFISYIYNDYNKSAISKKKDISTNQTLFLLFANMRGGSSFLGRIFAENPNMFYLYEPDWDIYNAMIASPIQTYPLHIVLNKNQSDHTMFRQMTKYEKEYLLRYYKYLYTCQYDKIPVEMLTSWTIHESFSSSPEYEQCLFGKNDKKNRIRNYMVKDCQKPFRQKCGKYPQESFQNGCHKYLEAAHDQRKVDIPGFPPVQDYIECSNKWKQRVKQCLKHIVQSCEQRKFKAGKVLRSNIEFMEDIKQVFPNLKVVHLLRDPRGVLASRREGHRSFISDITEEAKYLCPKMLHDIKIRQQLQLKYPNTFMSIRYEDVADHPNKAIANIYKFLKQPLPENVKKWLKSATNAKMDNNAFGEMRKNSSATARAWKKRVTAKEKKAIDQHCLKLYSEAGYPL